MANMINTHFFLRCLFSIFFYLWANSGIAQTNSVACDLPRGADKSFHLVMQTCAESLSASQRPESLAQDVMLSHPDDQWVKVHASSAETTPKTLVLSLGIPSAYHVIVWQLNNDGTQKLLQLNEQSSFYERSLWHRQLQVNVQLEPMQTTQWIIFYRTHAKTPLHLELTDPQFNMLDQSRDDLGNGCMFGVMILLIILLILLFAFYHSEVSFLFYAALVASNILFIEQLDGYDFAYWWPNSPQWNMNAPILFSTLMLLSHCLFAIKYLQLSWRYPRLYKIHLVLLGFTFFLFPLRFLFAVNEIYAVLMAIYSVLSVVAAGIAVRDGVTSARLYFLGTISLMLFSIILFSLNLLWKNIFPQINALTYPKIGSLLESVFFAIALVSQLIEYNRRQNELRLQRLTETEQLLQSEQARAQALALAEHNQLQLASASHDISQPLASIRFAMSALRFSEDQQKTTQHIDKTLNYAQTLLKDILDQSREDWSSVGEKISFPILFNQLEQEFTLQAKTKKLQLNIIYSQLECAGSTLIIYRILNNLLTNAIRYTAKGRVILGVRRRARGIELQVGDTGAGIPPEIVRSLLQPFQQGEQSQQGYGLGLFIVKSLCSQSGYLFSVVSKPGKGTLFSVYIPFAAE